MRSAARFGDLTCHCGIIISGSCDVFTNSRPSAAVGLSIATCLIHGIAPVVTGSCSVFINNLPASRVLDFTGCVGLIITGSCDVFIG
ncbi:PAAR domain-containing protein [Rouxiella sp. Mn2063]|uniref:PAAR domain-containing protein n=1 Tax=Rouxiella sp. Mn2063 TaxID=3395262 RepID=UPI003BDA8CBB